MAISKPSPLVLGLIVFFLLVRPARAFGAGNIAGISKVEGQNWRHGDIEDALLQIIMARAAGGKKFDKLNVSRVYFGNWLRDYSQAIDVGTVKAVSAEAIRLLLCVLGFLSFGFGSREFEVTAERLGCYRPEHHIDNPLGYAENQDARQYDRRLRGPVDEGVELAIDPETGMKNYIANERVNIMTSALHVRRLFGKCIELARSYRQSRNKAELYEALRLMGTGLHCLEDYMAHSNYTELALIEMGERDIFPHVGRDTMLRIQGARHEVYPIVTGTFGGVDFLHSVTGEVSDKLTQNEIQELEGTLENSQKNDTSILRNLLDKIPDGIFGGDNKKQKLDDIQQNANNAQMQQMNISPREPEEFTHQIKQIFDSIMPAIEFHDEILKSISEAIEKIPILPKIVEQLEDQLSMWTFSIMAPFVVPVIRQIKNELATGSSEIIQSSQNEQHVVFDNDRCSDPTHSMLSKDHFSNLLNEIAGRTASKIVSWVVPQLMEAWDDEGVDIDRTLNRIIYGVLHHPAQRNMGEDGAREGRAVIFQSIEEWWNSKSENEKEDYRRRLSRDGVLNGENHKEGVHDSGHGCGGPLGMHKNFGGGGGGNSMEDRIAGAAAGAIVGGITGTVGSIVESNTGYKLPSFDDKPSSGHGGGQQEESSGGLGGLLSAAGSILGGGFNKEQTETYHSSRRDDDGGYTQSTTQYGRNEDENRYGQAEYKRTEYPGGGSRTEYQRYEQQEDSYGSRPQGYGYEQRTETYQTSGGGYESRTESRYESSENRHEHHSGSRHGGGYEGGRQEESYGSGDSYGRKDEDSYGGGRRQEESYGSSDSYGRRDEDSYGSRRQEESYGGGYGERREEESSGWGGSRREEEDDRREDDNGGGLLDEIARRAEDAFGGDDNRERRSGWGF
ncbi:uncharacterized protein E0L32_003373 [Thyridium curvatum]|uniref:Uncharacterized protein n=1 Tax=Thyridium curvatum TaxID=1093900 RepID=A0A507B2A6_9PEZI|nr:uncharacterized protein E0L32_003373 [Thyridium curvatum]TPX17255.1 hypothetical protein E0L32_003373 [Thyridium curvatum]